MPSMTNPNQEADADLAAMQQEASAIESQIERYTQQIAVLSEKASAKRREAQEAFRAKHALMFKDLDVPKALTGAAVKHTFTIGHATYSVAAPSGEHARQVHLLVTDPIVKAKNAEGVIVATDVGPLSPAEVYLLKWLVELGMANSPERRKLETSSLHERLKLIRTLNEQVTLHIADRCKTLETYLNVCLELDLGNF